MDCASREQIAGIIRTQPDNSTHLMCGRVDAHGIPRVEQKLLCLSLLSVVLAPGILSGAENQHGQSSLFRASLHTWHLQNPAFDKQH